MTRFAESTVEEAALEWLEGLGYDVLHGPDIGPGEPASERASYGDVVLVERLRAALARINPNIPAPAREEAIRKLMVAESPALVGSNHRFHKFLVNGVPVEYQADDGRIIHDQVWLFDFEHADNNDWLAVNQFTVVEGQSNRRPDIVVFVNGLPLAVMEVKDATKEEADIWTAFNDHQTKKHDIPSLFAFNEVLVISDGLNARFGSLTADREWFLPWRTIEGDELAPATLPQLQVLIQGLFEKRRFLDFVRHFVVFEDEDAGLVKKLAGYHQYHAVNQAVAATVSATGPGGDKRVGVVWHTQGSGKSLTMAFYAGRIILEGAMKNPTLVVLTDRNDLDDQLFGTFARCHELLRQEPVQAESRADLREKLKVAAGGVVFTTIQKFFPEEKGDRYPALSDRRNIVVIADEAHRSQYDSIDGFARHMRDALPNASFIGFTGTPLELEDKNTRAVFGDYISIYDIRRAVDDGATVPIYYESRLAKLGLKPEQLPQLDPEFDEVTEDAEESAKEKLKTKWAALEAIVGTEARVSLIAEDLVRHFEERLDALDGKAMIVCMSRRICVEMFDAITRLRPHWRDNDDGKGVIKVVMTGSASDRLEWQPHIRNKPRREALAKRFRNADDPFKVVIVRDMWLTGFDAPSLHTMYVDKPMRGHGLMQAIARVNRVFRDKPGGLVVDYLGLADQLKRALATYAQSGGAGRTAIDIQEAAAVMLEKFEIASAMLRGFNYTAFFTGTSAERLAVLPPAQEHVLQQDDGKARFMKAVTELSQAFALASTHETALQIRDDIGFFQAVRAALAKSTGTDKAPEDYEHAIRQIISKAIVSDEVIDIFAAAGLSKPDISILSDEFLAEIRDMPQRNLAVELLRKLLSDELKTRQKKNLVQSRSFGEMLERAVKAYQNRAIETAQVIEELIQLAKDMKAAEARGEDLGLNDEELAFYDALEVNDSAVKVLGDETLRTIARELVETVKRNVTIDWSVKESVQAKLRTIVRRILRKYGYPPDKQEQATKTVLQQAELLAWESA
ncbi:MAG: type I restriction endonuclease subunit R [Dehalococcoidia bacterium]